MPGSFMDDHPGLGEWPPLRMANWSLKKLTVLSIREISPLLYGVTMQIGDRPHFCDLGLAMSEEFERITCITRRLTNSHPQLLGLLALCLPYSLQARASAKHKQW